MLRDVLQLQRGYGVTRAAHGGYGKHRSILRNSTTTINIPGMFGTK